jgi:hypothetical protein
VRRLLARHRQNALRDRLGLKACERGHRVAFATAQEWVSKLEAAQDRNQLEAELRRLERYHLLIVDEVGYLPLERQAANLLFALVSRRYERGSIIITSNRGFEQWGEILGDAMVAAALIDRLVHHATMITSKARATASANAASTSRPPLRRESRVPAALDAKTAATGAPLTPCDHPTRLPTRPQWCTFRLRKLAHFSAALDNSPLRPRRTTAIPDPERKRGSVRTVIVEGEQNERRAARTASSASPRRCRFTTGALLRRSTPQVTSATIQRKGQRTALSRLSAELFHS